MPLTHKGEVIKAAMQKEYGPKKGEQVLYASKNAGTITGIDENALDAGIQSVGPASMTTAEINRKANEYWKQWARDDGIGTPQKPSAQTPVPPVQVHQTDQPAEVAPAQPAPGFPDGEPEVEDKNEAKHAMKRTRMEMARQIAQLEATGMFHLAGPGVKLDIPGVGGHGGNKHHKPHGPGGGQFI